MSCSGHGDIEQTAFDIFTVAPIVVINDIVHSAAEVFFCCAKNKDVVEFKPLDAMHCCDAHAGNLRIIEWAVVVYTIERNAVLLENTAVGFDGGIFSVHETDILKGDFSAFLGEFKDFLADEFAFFLDGME